MSPFWIGFAKRAAEAEPLEDWELLERSANTALIAERDNEKERNLRVDPRELQAWYSDGDFR